MKHLPGVLALQQNKVKRVDLGRDDAIQFSKANLLLLLLCLAVYLGPLGLFVGAGSDRGGQLYYVDLVVVGLLLFLLVRNVSLPSPPAEIVAWIVLNVWLTLSIWWSLDPGRSSYAVVRMWIAVMLAYMVFRLVRQTGTSPRLAIRLFGVTLAITVLVSAITAFTNRPTGLLVFYTYKEQIVAPLGGSNFLAAFLSFCLVYEILRGGKYSFFVLPLQAVALVLTLSKGAAIALLLVSPLILAYRLRQNPGSNQKPLIYFLIIGVAAAALSGITVDITESSVESTERSTESRTFLWVTGLQAFVTDPWKGVGYGAYASLLPAHHDPSIRDPHNWAIQALAETGLVGAMSFMLFLGLLLRRLRSKFGGGDPEVASIAVAIFALSVHSLIEPFFFTPLGMVWIAIFSGVIAGRSAWASRHRAAPPATYMGKSPSRLSKEVK